MRKLLQWAGGLNIFRVEVDHVAGREGKELQIWMDNNGSLDDAGLKGSKGKAKAKDTAMDTGGKSGSGEEKKKKKKKAVPSTR